MTAMEHRNRIGTANFHCQVFENFSRRHRKATVTITISSTALGMGRQ
jgi:hypothetical protein